MNSHTAFYFPPSDKSDGPPFLSRTENVLHAFRLCTFSLLVLLTFIRISSASFLQSARIARSRESHLDSCRPMSLGSYRLESRRDLQTANKVCGLYPFSPERETCCILTVNQLSRAYFLTKWKKCNIVSLFLQIHIVESTIHHSLMRMVPLSLQNGKRFACFR